MLARTAGWTSVLMLAALLGAVFPDLDLIWFYLVDDRAFHHHKYWVHAPAFALMVSIALVIITRRHPVAVAFAAGWCLHILLDAPTGGLMWLWPHSDELFIPIAVEPTRSHWVLSFLSHWTFAFELIIWAAAAWLYLRNRLGD